jgi:hypothetical protein
MKSWDSKVHSHSYCCYGDLCSWPFTLPVTLDPASSTLLVLTQFRLPVSSQHSSRMSSPSHNWSKPTQYYTRPKYLAGCRLMYAQVIFALLFSVQNWNFELTWFISFSLIIKTSFDNDSLRSEVSGLRDNLLGAMDRVDATTISGFLTSYGFLCDFFGVQYNNEIAWVSLASSLSSLPPSLPPSLSFSQ